MSSLSVQGLGIDIVSVPRIERMVEQWGEGFLNRVFTRSELDYCLPKRRKYEHLAGRFAAKETVIKAVGKRFPWKSIEILSGESGRPSVCLCSEEKEVIPAGADLQVSITHQKNFALALAILEIS